MAYDYGYGPLENQLVDACKEYPPDFEKIRSLIAQGADLNAASVSDPDENMLSQIILGYPEIAELHEACVRCTDDNCDGCGLNYRDADGRYLPQIIALFLENGFDVSKNERRFGAMCLQNLTWSSYDKYILDGTKLLLKAGATPNISPWCNEDEHETVMSWVATKESAAKFVHDDPEQARLFGAMYEIIDAYLKRW